MTTPVKGSTSALTGQTRIAIELLNSATRGLQDLQALMRSLQRDLATARNRARDVGSEMPQRQHGESDADFSARQNAWLLSVEDARAQVKAVNLQIERVAKKIERVQDDLDRLQFQDLPKAQRADSDTAQTQLDNLRKELESMVQGGATPAEAEEQQLQLRVQIQRRELQSRGDSGATTTRTYDCPQLDLINLSRIFAGLSYEDLRDNAAGPAKTSAKQGGGAHDTGLAGSDGDPVGGEPPAGMSPEAKAAWRDMQKRLTQMIASAAAPKGAGNPGSTYNDAQAQWADLLAKLPGSSAAWDVNALVQSVLRESYTEITEGMRIYAQKVQYYNDLKKAIRAELTYARDALGAALRDNPNLKPGDALPTAFVGAADFPMAPVPDANGDIKMAPIRDENGNLNPGLNGKTCATRQDLEDYIAELEQNLSTAGEDSQLAALDMQNMMQQQQQALQMISNISKMLHDTAMAIIRKIG